METVYKQSTVHSPAKTTQSLENCGIQLLGQIKNGSCRPRAILFKVLADTVGLQSRLVVVSIQMWSVILSITPRFACD